MFVRHRLVPSAVAVIAGLGGLTGVPAADATPATVTVSGVVADGYYGSTTPLPDASHLVVTAYPVKGEYGETYTGGHVDATDGSYSITLPVNRGYQLHFTDTVQNSGTNGNFGAVWYGGSVVRSGASIIQVGTANLTGRNVIMPLGGTLTGNVSFDPTVTGVTRVADLQAFILDASTGRYDTIAQWSVAVFPDPSTPNDVGFSLPGLPTGTYVVRAASQLWTQWVSSPIAVTSGVGHSMGTISLQRTPQDVVRYAGADRYDTAAQAAVDNATTERPVFIASGTSFADALSGGPAAAVTGGSLLLVPGGSIPSSVSSALTALEPSHIYVLGGTAAVSDQVLSALQHWGPVTRLSGPDRYATSRAVIRAFWPTAAKVYIATGTNFPDALSVGPVAGMQNAPLLLVPGSASAADSSTVSLLHSLGTSDVRIAGGTASVSASLGASLGAISGVDVAIRYAGADRYETASSVTEDNVPFSDGILLATGLNFPDALAGSAIGGELGDPIFLVPRDCVPADEQVGIAEADAPRVLILGGTQSVADDALANSCTPAG